MKEWRLYSIIICMFFIFSISINNYIINSENSTEINDQNNLTIKAIHPTIYVTGSNWSQAVILGWCTGSGTQNEPYVIEDLIIDATDSPTGSGILIESSTAYFRIQNCTIYNANSSWGDAGIRIYQSSNGLLYDNNCSYNNRAGIFVSNCASMILTENEAHHNMQFGIGVGNTPSALLEGNTVSYNGGIIDPDIGGNGSGIGIISSNLVVLIDNTAYNNLNFGIHAGYSNYTNILNCESKNNGYHGIGTDHSHDNTIVGNIVENCEVGIIAGGYGFNISNNEILDSNSFGILVEGNNESTINGNIVRNSVESGILMKNGTRNSINDNIVTDNFRNGIALNDCFNVTIDGNSISNNNDHGIRFQTSDNNTISNNEIMKNGQYGIFLTESNFNEIINNKLIGNQDCFYEVDCQGNIFTDNTCGRIVLRYSLIGVAALLVIIAVPIVIVSFRKRK
ncbi:MAG: hypothetical protein FK733_07005 [Asgard group archaeon]|nr:hypothetical protein [Asgard group archaeon]